MLPQPLPPRQQDQILQTDSLQDERGKKTVGDDEWAHPVLSHEPLHWLQGH